MRRRRIIHPVLVVACFLHACDDESPVRDGGARDQRGADSTDGADGIPAVVDTAVADTADVLGAPQDAKPDLALADAPDAPGLVPTRQLDVLFVIDNSSSMREEQLALRRGFRVSSRRSRRRRVVAGRPNRDHHHQLRRRADHAVSRVPPPGRPWSPTSEAGLWIGSRDGALPGSRREGEQQLRWSTGDGVFLPRKSGHRWFRVRTSCRRYARPWPIDGQCGESGFRSCRCSTRHRHPE